MGEAGKFLPALLADFREFYGFSAYEIGTGSCLWSEGVHLIVELVNDTRTRLSCKIAGVKYRASENDALLLSVIASIGGVRKSDVARLSPFDKMRERATKNSITEKERIKATHDFLKMHGLKMYNNV